MSQVTTTLEEIRQLDKIYERRIPRKYLDENEHVNVQYYLHLVEHGLGAIFDRVGLGAVYAKADVYGNFALEQHIRYLAEILLDDLVGVYIRLIDLSPKRGYFMGFLVNETREQLAATVEVVMMNVDIAQRRGVPFTADAGTQLQAMLIEHNNLSWAPPVCGVMGA